MKKTTTATRMATPRDSFPVTVGTFQAGVVEGVGRDTVGQGGANREPRTDILEVKGGVVQGG